MRELIAVYEREHLASLTLDRRRTAVRVLDDFSSRLCGGYGAANALRASLMSLTERGRSDGTLRKSRAVVLAFAAWAWREGHITGDELLALREIRLIGAPARETTPQPYRPSELRRLRDAIDTRWPKRPEDEALKWLGRVSDGRSPYARVRTHVIGCQLRAVLALALHLGLRRREIFSLTVAAAHPENDQLVVFRDMSRSLANCRGVPYAAAAQAAMSDWIACRDIIAPGHDRPWLNLHAGPTIRQPLSAETFNRLLGTCVGQGWSLKRLRDTCAVGWLRVGLPPERLRELLGLARVEDVLPYMRLMPGTLEGHIAALDGHFDELVGAVRISQPAG